MDHERVSPGIPPLPIVAALAELSARLRVAATAVLRGLQAGELPASASSAAEEALRDAVELADVAIRLAGQLGAAMVPTAGWEEVAWTRGAGIDPIPEVDISHNAGVADAAIFRREGEVWVLAYRGVVVRLRNCLGLVYLSELLRYPGRKFHAVLLEAEAHEERARPASDGCTSSASPSRASVARIQELRDELDNALRNHDRGRSQHLRASVEAAETALLVALGHGVSGESVGREVERARLNVSRAVASAVQKVERYHGELGAHLRATVRTGRFCAYTPDPHRSVHWETQSQSRPAQRSGHSESVEA